MTQLAPSAMDQKAEPRTRIRIDFSFFAVMDAFAPPSPASSCTVHSPGAASALAFYLTPGFVSTTTSALLHAFPGRH